jgi:hypothetical protein
MNLLVSRCVVNEGEQPRVVFYRVLRSLNQLIEAHNSLVRELLPEKVQVDTVERHYIGQKPPVLVHVNDPQDVVDLLFQMRYTCTCVGPTPMKTKTATWCSTCHRLVDDA